MPWTTIGLTTWGRAARAAAFAGSMGLGVMLQACTPPVIAIDGDKLRDGKEVIRIMGLDAPEIEHAKCDAERALGQRAKARLEQLMATGPVVIERSDKKDRSGQTLARVLIAGRDAAAILIEERLAAPWDGGPISPSWCPA